MSVELQIANYLRLAADDIDGADVLRKSDNRNDAYLAEQAAEKLLMALLTSEGIKPDRKDNHRLDVLRDLLPETNPFKERFRALTFLTRFATTYRYPKDGGRIPERPQQERLEVALAELRRLVTDLAGHFKVELQASDREPADNPAAPRI